MVNPYGSTQKATFVYRKDVALFHGKCAFRHDKHTSLGEAVTYIVSSLGYLRASESNLNLTKYGEKHYEL